MVGNMRILRHWLTDWQTDWQTDGAGFIGPADRQGGSNNAKLNYYYSWFNLYAKNICFSLDYGRLVLLIYYCRLNINRYCTVRFNLQTTQNERGCLWTKRSPFRTYFVSLEPRKSSSRTMTANSQIKLLTSWLNGGREWRSPLDNSSSQVYVSIDIILIFLEIWKKVHLSTVLWKGKEPAKNSPL